MNSESQTIFSKLPDDITKYIYDMHTVHYSIHNHNLSLVHKELISNYMCENCDCIKSSYLFKAQYCGMICYMQARDDPYRITI